MKSVSEYTYRPAIDLSFYQRPRSVSSFTYLCGRIVLPHIARTIAQCGGQFTYAKDGTITTVLRGVHGDLLSVHMFTPQD